jgi:hypothetical protein
MKLAKGCKDFDAVAHTISSGMIFIAPRRLLQAASADLRQMRWMPGYNPERTSAMPGVRGQIARIWHLSRRRSSTSLQS